MKFPAPVLMLVTEPNDRLSEIVGAAVAGGVNIVQLRTKPPVNDLLEAAKSIRKITAESALLVINTNAFVAREAEADGVHLPEEGWPAQECARDEIGKKALIGRSVHTVESAYRAEQEGADYLIASPIFKTTSHPGEPPAGLSFLRAVCESVSIPVMAIGGITPENAGDCLAAGSAGVAVLSGIMRAGDPCAEAKRYRLALDEACAAWVRIA